MSMQSPYAHWLGTSVGTYRLEQLLEQGAAGPVFLGRERASGAAVRLRILTIAAAQTPEAAGAVRATLEREAAPLAALLHPFILPLSDYGLQQGLPYLVWPHLVMRSLSARLAQSGSMDVVTAGRYVDQIAAALEAAHARGILHRNVSTECVFLQLDGQTVVADFGVRRLLELLGAGEPTRPFYGSLEACAPEQLVDGPVGPYTDVYALGALTFRLLTGEPVFIADTLDALLQQHRYRLVPSVRGRRLALPGELDPLFARALAKEPAARFPSPGAFADAYHAVVSPGHGNRVPIAARSAAFRPSPQQSSGGAPSGWASSPSSPQRGDDLRHAAPAPPPDNGAPSARAIAANPPAARRGRAATLARRGSSISAMALLVLLFVSGGLFIFGGNHLLPGAAARASGEVDVVDSPTGPPGHSDALRLSAKGLPAPRAGSHYAAWILDRRSERVVPLGALSGVDQTYALAYDGDGARGQQPGTNLVGAGDTIEITLERGEGNVPLGAIVLVGRLPPHAAEHIRHLLVGFADTPGNIGLLVGLLAQTQELNEQAKVLQHAQAIPSTAAVQCSAQSILDIIEGARGANYRALPAGCAALHVSLVGDGYGLLALARATPPGAATAGYLDGSADHASRAATQDDATAAIRRYARHVEVAIANITGWVTDADRDALALLAAPTDPLRAADLATQCDHAYHGVPSSTDQQIHPAPGQAGAMTAYEQGQFMATVTLAPGP